MSDTDRTSRRDEMDCTPEDEWNNGIHQVQNRAGLTPFRIGLKRVPSRGKTRGPVLLVHGASASSRTFEVPNGGLAHYLRDQNWDVWMLDWRSSGILSPLLIDRIDLDPERFNLDEAQDDLVGALNHISRQTGYDERIPVVAHCIGGALVAQAIATGRAADQVGSIVLTTLGLFFNSGIDDWVKGNERFLEEVWWTLKQNDDRRKFFISPWVAREKYHHPWPKQLEDAYQLWRLTPLPHNCKNEFCHRACFMFGMPYRLTDMETIHDGRFPDGLWAQFGRMPLATYMHCVQNLRRGWVAPWQGDDSDTDYLNPKPFANRRITLITGNENQVWHRDSIDRMYEWLRRELRPRDGDIVKHVLPGYGHQDLYWSSKAVAEVYACIAERLKPIGESTATASIHIDAIRQGSSTHHAVKTVGAPQGAPAATP